MPRKKGYQRARLLRGKEPGPGREAAPDGLDRSDPDGLAPLADAFLLAQQVKNYSDRTLDTRRYALTIFLQWAQDRELKRPETITKPILESYQRHLWNYRKKDGKPLSVGTQIGRLTAVRQLFKWLCKENHLTADPAAHLEMPKEDRRLPEDTLSEAEVSAVLSVPNIADPLGVRDRAILELFYSTALRRSELARLELRDLNPDRKILFVRHGKGAKDRVVPVGKRALEWITRYLDEVRPLLRIDMVEQSLFLTGYGRGFSPNSLGNLVRGTVTKAIGNRGSCHLLRHACATHMHERGADIRVIQQLLGHAKLETTQIYTEVSIKQLREVHERTHPAEASSNNATSGEK